MTRPKFSREETKLVAPLTPMQQGMLHHTLLHPDSPAYHQQLLMRLDGHLDLERLRLAWEQTLHRHDALRGVFVSESVSRPVQVIPHRQAVRIEPWHASGPATTANSLPADPPLLAQDQSGADDALPATVRDCLAADRARPFAPDREHAMRWTRIAESDERNWLLWSFHHILLDGWSIGRVLHDVLAAYRDADTGLNATADTRTPGGPHPSPPPPTSAPPTSAPPSAAPDYNAYLNWLGTRDGDVARAYWRDTLAGHDAASLVTLLGQDNPPRTAPTGDSQACTDTHAPLDGDANTTRIRAELTPATQGHLHQLAARAHATLSHVLSAAWAVVNGRFLGREDVVIGAVLAGRPAEVEAIEDMAGLFITTVPLRVCWNTGTTVEALIASVREQTLAAARHAHLPLPDLLAQAATPLPLDSLLLVQSLPFDAVVGPVTDRLALTRIAFFEHTPFALELSATPGPQGLRLEWITRTAVLAEAQLECLRDAMLATLEAFAAEASSARAPRQIAELDCISPAWHERLLAWGDGGPLPEAAATATTVPALLARAHDAHPTRPALIADPVRLDYRQLHAAAARMAHHLQATLDAIAGATQGTMGGHTAGDGTAQPRAPQPRFTQPRVALVCERSAALVVSLLAIVRAGAAYVPVDPDFPPERIALMLEDSGCTAALISPTLRQRIALPPGVIAIDAVFDADNASSAAAGVSTQAAALPQLRPPSPDDLAYLIYTSGSTGRPKGVRLFQRNAAGFFATLAPSFGFAPGQRLLALTTVSFDIAALELLGALAHGMTVVLADATQARDPERLVALIETHAIDVLQTTPTRLRMILEAPGGERALARLATLLVGGEALPRDLAARLARLATTTVHNVYGPTETTIWSAASIVRDDAPTLGRPLPGERIFVLSPALRPQPPGAPGEIAIAGAGVGGGYHERPELSAERFILRPELAEGPIYLTGDLGRWDHHGNLHYLGRNDDQIKIRGMRIEAGEVEQALRALPDVRDAVVLARPGRDGIHELVAWVVCPDLPPLVPLTPQTVPLWRAELARHLPEACIPAHFVRVEALPQTPNGKIDRRALPAPDDHDPAGAQPTAGARAPDGPRERAIVDAFADVLGTPVGPDDDFFIHGGHSLRAMQAIGRINRALKAHYRLNDLYLARTPAALARLQPDDGTGTIPQAPDLADYPLTATQTALWVLEQQHPGYRGYIVPGLYRVHGAFDPDLLRRAWDAVTARHEALRTVFVMRDGEPRQRIVDDLPAEWIEEDWRGKPIAAAHARAAELTADGFDLVRGPLFRIAWLRTDPPAEAGGVTHATPGSRTTHDDTDAGLRHGLLLLVAHHLITDGWSDQLLARDLSRACAALGAGQAVVLDPPPPCRFRDFAFWQRQTEDGTQARAHRDAWRRRLLEPTPAPALQLPADGPRATTAERLCAQQAFVLDGPAGQDWRAQIPAARRSAALIAASFALLHIESGQTDLVIGMPVAGRERPELQDQVGLHLNMLPLRLRIDPALSLRALVEQCAHLLDDALSRAEYPFARLVEALGIATPPGRHPVFDVMLIIHQHDTPVFRLDGAEVTPLPSPTPGGRFDLDIELWLDDAGLHGFLEYDRGLFSSSRAATWGAHLHATLMALAQAPERSLAALRTTLTGYSEARERADFVAQSLALDEDF